MPELNLREGFLRISTKAQWKVEVKSKIKELNRAEILHQIKRYRKLDYFDLKHEQYELKPYLKTMNLCDARTMFRIRSQMILQVKLSCMNDEVYANENYACEECGCISSYSHIKWCPGYEHLRKYKDLNNPTHLVHYFQEVMKLRDETDKRRQFS